jgi:hypothetical protein
MNYLFLWNTSQLLQELDVDSDKHCPVSVTFSIVISFPFRLPATRVIMHVSQGNIPVQTKSWPFAFRTTPLGWTKPIWGLTESIGMKPIGYVRVLS